MSEPSRPLADRVALVTGGSGALGRRIVAALAAAGCRAVLVGHLRSEDAARAIVDEARRLGAEGSRALSFSVTSSAAVDGAVAEVVGTLGRIDILVCAAGVNANAVTWRMDDERWSAVIDVNLSGVHRVTRAVLPAMRAAGSGRVVVLSSVVAQRGVPGTSAYAASKAGLFGYVRAVASEVAASNVTVNALALGYFEGGMLEQVPDDARAVLLSHIPLRRFGDPEHVGRIVVFLAGPGGDYVTGQVINLNGGIVG